MSATAEASIASRPIGLSRARTALAVFTLTSFVGSALLFLVQPLVARMLLPSAGGSASLWSTAMVFFQVSLLAGYLFAHFSITRFGIARHRYIQLALLAGAVLTLPIGVPAGWSLDSAQPILDTLGVLTAMVGLAFFALATASPTLQRWFAETGHPQAHDPYFLYAAGNIGSIGALLAYPLLIEPHLGLRAQATMFGLGYGTLFALTALCAMLVRVPQTDHRREFTPAVAATTAAIAPPSITWAQRRRWVILAAVPSALLLGVTRHLATDVASFPLLWVIPLMLYLLTYVVAFRPRAERHLGPVNKVVLIGAIGLPLSFLGMSLPATVAIHLGWFFAAALLCHLRLAAGRPPATQLTEFYAWLSVGGALGGATVALVAPVVFDRVWEYPLAIMAAVGLALPLGAASRSRAPVLAMATVAGLLGAGAWFRASDDLRLAAAALGVAGAIAYLAIGRPRVLAAVCGVTLAVVVSLAPTQAVHRDRSFFGSYEVRAYDNRTELVMGTTIHGRELADAPDHATSYYHPAGPLGEIFDQRSPAPTAVGVVGLGVGEIAAYGRPGDTMAFFEIDPVVADIATDTRWFSHLERSPAQIDIQIGDGRILVERLDARFEILAIDAFSSDAIPVHLLTVEAIEAYLDHTSADGVVLLHISNRYFDLAPVLGRIAETLGVTADLWHYDPAPADRASGASSSRWVAIRPLDSHFELGDTWAPIAGDGRLWTDDFSDLLSTLDL